ncbi:hypothetical protein L0F63_007255 [Massospora cicadina]|nr:hypothetical protein L0F63_007255 [Massospora cicadina]
MEVLEGLSKVSEAELTKLFGSIFAAEAEDTPEAKGRREKLRESVAQAAVQPVASAIDFSDFNDLAEDSAQSRRYLERGLSSLRNPEGAMKPGTTSRTGGDEDDYDMDEAKPPETTQTEDEPEKVGAVAIRSPVGEGAYTGTPLSLSEIKRAYPAFEPNSVLKFSELFANPHFKKPRTDYRPVGKTDATLRLEDDTRRLIDERVLFESGDLIRQSSGNLLQELLALCRVAQESRNPSVPDPSQEATVEDVLDSAVCPDIYTPLVLEPWEDNIIWDGDAMVASDEDPTAKPLEKQLSYHNHALDEGTWETQICWSEEDAEKVHFPVIFDLNDTNMLFEFANKDSKAAHPKTDDVRGMRLMKRAKKLGLKGITLLTERDPLRDQLDKFNLSNDLYYEALLTGKVRVRQTFGQIVVQHAAVALRLQQPFFKTKLTKSDLRRWHRQPVLFPIGVALKLNRVRATKRKKHRPKPNEEIMETPKEVTLKDGHPFVMLEFSEEYPPIVQNVGMGSLIINYYRRKHQDDDYIHDVNPAPPANLQPDIGEPITLDVTDVSPFMNFGNVEPGQFMLCYYNNLFKAPIFHHAPRPNDFLLIRHSLGGKTKYYLREITDLYVAGQTYPQLEVPGPHSRRITSTIKNRLQVAAYRLIRRNPKQHLRIQRLTKYFPEYNEGQIRTKLKEFAEFQRSGPSTGFWKVKPHLHLPDEEELRKSATPEMICLYESMLVGKRHLQDAGYGKSLEEEDNADDPESKLTIEEQLAPWIITRNFINATQGKAMLKLYGEGDPTGRGEGFSFVRVSMKDIFLRAGESAEEKLAEIEARPKSAHRYNVAEQQQIYREEITRIWNTQNQSLASPEDFPLTDVDSDEDLGLNSQRPPLNREPSATSELRTARSSRQPSPSPSVPDQNSVTDPNGRDDVSIDSFNSGASAAVPKILIVRRLMRVHGRDEWVEETLRNPAVIKAYTRCRDAIRDSTSTYGPDVLSLTYVSEPLPVNVLKQRTHEQLTRVQRSRERRIARLKAQEAKEGGTIPSHLAPRGKKELVRKCGNCGMLGHMKTNRKCPKYEEAKP